jgi:hypothetical protein
MMYVSRNLITEIMTEYDGVMRVRFQLAEREVKRALVEFMERECPERLLDGGEWLFKWLDGGNVILTQEVIEKDRCVLD